MDPVYDSDLLWIAEELLLCPMPEAWQIFSDKSTARPYYYHCVERRSQWSHPMLDYFAGLFFMRKEGDLRVAEKEQATPATPAEVVHMCKYLHIDPRREPHLAHVARQAVNAPLPPLWEQYADDESGETVYYSKRTKVTTQQHPLDAYFLELAKRARAKWVKENPDGVPESYYRVGDYANLNTSFVPEGWMEFTDPASEVGARGRVCWYNFAKAEVAYVHPSQIVREELKLRAVLLLQSFMRGYRIRKAAWVLRRDGGASTIQRMWRGRAARARAHKLRYRVQNDAATVIQAVARGYLQRQRNKTRTLMLATIIIQGWWRGRKKVRAARNSRARGLLAIPDLPPDALDMPGDEAQERPVIDTDYASLFQGLSIERRPELPLEAKPGWRKAAADGGSESQAPPRLPPPPKAPPVAAEATGAPSSKAPSRASSSKASSTKGSVKASSKAGSKAGSKASTKKKLSRTSSKASKASSIAR